MIPNVYYVRIHIVRKCGQWFPPPHAHVYGIGKLL